MDYTCNNMVTEATPPACIVPGPSHLAFFWCLKEFI